MKSETPREKKVRAGRLGYQATLARHGKAHMLEIAKRGGRATVAKYGNKFMSEIARRKVENDDALKLASFNAASISKLQATSRSEEGVNNVSS